jgi:hypothetical protein
MAESPSSQTGASAPEYNLRALETGLFDTAKGYWRNNLLCKGFAASYGIASVLLDMNIGTVVIPVFLLTVLSEVFSHLSDSTKGLAQRLHDKLDLRDSFGWKIENDEVRTFVVKAPGMVRESAQKDAPEPWFENTGENTVQRALENLEESSWWTEELSSRAFSYLMWISLGVAVVVVVYLVVVALYMPQQRQPTGTRIGIAVLSLLPSLGVIKLILGYYALSQASLAIRKEAHKFLAEYKRVPPEVSVIKLWFEYQAKRSSAPMLPSWIYDWNRDLLNKLWKDYK